MELRRLLGLGCTAFRLRLPAPLRRNCLRTREVHRLRALADVEEIDGADAERLRQVEHHPQAGVADAPLQLLVVPRVDPRRCGGVLLREAAQPSRLSQVSTEPLQDDLEVHGIKVACSSVVLEATRSTYFS